MKKILSLLLVLFIIFNIIPTSIATTNIYKESVSEETKETDISYHRGYTLLKNGRLKEFTDQNRVISEKIQVVNNNIYHFKNLSAKYGNCFYVIYDSNNEVISYLRANESTTGEVIENIRIIMPENASYFRVACDLNVNNKMFEITTSYTKLNGKRVEPAIISFTDDDCRSEVYTELYPLIKELNLPYTLACPPNSLNDKDGKYMTTEQLKEVYANGVDIVSHHLKEKTMTSFESIKDYEDDTKACLEKFENMGIEVKGVSYPNGRINDEYMTVVKENFKLGFTTDRGINTLPYESYYIDRCEVFPKSGIYNLDDAKSLVDSVAENGGWLVFMTHCWYDTFSLDELKELVNYIRSKDIEISNITDVIENYANPIEMGIVKKPFTDMSEDFFVMDCKGRIYTNNIEMTNIETNNMTVVEKSSVTWKEEAVDYNIAVTLGKNGKEKNFFEVEEILSEEQILQRKQNVSTKIHVIPNSIYKLTNISAKSGNCFYVIYDSDNNVISYQAASDLTIGETLDEITITMPENASYLKMACDLNINNKMFKVYSATINDKNISYHTGYTLLKSGKVKEFTDENRIISEKIVVDYNCSYYLKNLSAKYGNCFYVIYNANNEVISYLKTNESSTGEVIENLKVTMPEDASYFRVACDLNVNDKMFEVIKTYTE